MKTLLILLFLLSIGQLYAQDRMGSLPVNAAHSGTPTIAAGPGSGSSPTVIITKGNDTDHQVSILTGSSPAATSIIATITFASPFQSTDPNIVFSQANLITASVITVVSMKATSATTYVITGTLAANTSYLFNVKASDRP